MRSTLIRYVATPLYNASGLTWQGSKLTGYTESVAQTSFSFTYDANGRLATAAGTPATGATSGLAQSYNETTSFNGLSNLATATDSVLNASSTWSYAAAGEAVTAIQHATGTSADGADGSIHAPGGP